MDRILFVEDDPIQAETVRFILAEAGYSVSHYPNAFDALESLKSEEYDLLLTDCYMPNMSGIDLLKAVKSSEFDLPVVLLTAASDVSIAFEALKAGADDFISKDIGSNYLSLIDPVIKRTLSGYQAKKHAEKLNQQLEFEKNLSRRTLNALSEGVVVVNENDQITFINQRCAEILELEAGYDLALCDLEWLMDLINSRLDTSEPQWDMIKFVQFLEDSELRLNFKSNARHFDLQSTPIGDDQYVILFSDITESKKQLGFLDAVFAQAPVPMLAVNEDGFIVLANTKASELIGDEKDMSIELLGCDIERLVPAAHRDGHKAKIQSYFRNMEPRVMRQGLDLQLVTFGGREVPVEISLSGLDIEGQECVLATVVDLTQRKEAERMLKQAHELTQSMIEYSPFSIAATDEHGLIVSVSPALERLLWYARDELIGKANATIFHEQGELAAKAHELSKELKAEIDPDFSALVAKAQRGVVEGTEFTYVRKDGSKLPVNLTVTTLRNAEGEVTGYLLVAYDITEQKRAHEYIEHIAHHDGLTGLPNRTLMQDRMGRELARIERFGGLMGVMVLDLDHFKRINDSLGHMAGDALLKEVAERLTSSVRASDTVCRMGGDEFVVLLPEVKGQKDIETVAEKILHQIASPIVVGINTLVVTPSIGICFAPRDGTTPEELLKHADIAMYHAKQAGRNVYKVFHGELAETKMESIAIEQALHEAFRAEQLAVHYQPQVNPSDSNVIGFEALLRWDDPEKGAISPAQFIPMAETTGFIVTLGDWVLKRACLDIQALRLRHGTDYRIAVNVSPKQFEHSSFLPSVESALANSGLPASALELEITEGLLISETGSVLNKLEKLKKMGVMLAIDDFGTGYSSLSYVSKYPIDIIKIDRSFMSLEDKANVAIVSAVAAIGTELGLEVIAEGVETAEQLEFVRHRGCEQVQGFLFSPAVPISDVPAMVKSLRKEAKLSRVK